MDENEPPESAADEREEEFEETGHELGLDEEAHGMSSGSARL